MINRDGDITHVIVGDAHRLFIPDLKRHRAGDGRFRGIPLDSYTFERRTTHSR